MNPKNIILCIYKVAILIQQERSISLKGSIYQVVIMNQGRPVMGRKFLKKSWINPVRFFYNEDEPLYNNFCRLRALTVICKMKWTRGWRKMKDHVLVPGVVKCQVSTMTGTLCCLWYPASIHCVQKAQGFPTNLHNNRKNTPNVFELDRQREL